MRLLSLRLIVALIVGVTVVSLALSWYEVQAEKNSLRRDLEYKAEILNESLAANAEFYLRMGDKSGLDQLTQRYSNRDHLIGIGIYGRDGSTLAITHALNSVFFRHRCRLPFPQIARKVNLCGCISSRFTCGQLHFIPWIKASWLESS